jgi:subtilase family serine protease
LKACTKLRKPFDRSQTPYLGSLTGQNGIGSMTSPRALRFIILSALSAALAAGSLACAQSADRIARIVNGADVQPLANHHPAWAVAANDAGVVPADLPLENMTLVLARSPAQEQAFEQLLKDQQDPSSPEFHHWLTPAEVGDRFGLSDNDIASITGWLQSQGLHVSWISPSRIFIGFGGSAANMGRAFKTEFHSYRVNGNERISVSSDPAIPAAIAPAIKAIRGLYTIDDHPFSLAIPMQLAAPTLTASGNGQTVHFIAPADFATIYDVPSNITGTGITIGIVGESRTDMADYINFRSLTGSSFSSPTEIVPTAYGGVDPGTAYTAPPNCESASNCSSTVTQQLGAQSEATLDVLRAGTVAPSSRLLLVTATHASGGVAADAEYLVHTSPLPANVISISFGACESEAGSSGVQFWDSLFQVAVGEGISVIVASGDSGASGCDAYFSTPPSSPRANSPNYICSSSYATCVGGTEFNDASNPSLYWNANNGTGLSSALSYIPEGAWNEPLNSSGGTQTAASGGGASAYIGTPNWQTGTGVPTARTGRYTPDVAFSSASHDGYFACFAAGGGSCVSGFSGIPFEIFGGTSAAAPSMAGVAALLDQSAGSAQGNLNPGIYTLATNAPAAFHAVSIASSGVTNCSVTTPSMCNNSIPSPTGIAGGRAGFLLGATGGYNEVTGWGSLDISQFINDYSVATSILTPKVTLNAPQSITTAQPATITVTVNGGTGNPVPSGSITLTSGTYSSGTIVLTNSGNGTDGATVTIPAGKLTVGTDALTANYTSSSSSYNNVTVTATITVTDVSASTQTPSATTGGASVVTDNSATLNGQAASNGNDTHVCFKYGTSSDLGGGTQTASQDIGSNAANAAISASITGLTPNTTYYFQAVAQSSMGTTTGIIQSFTTASAPPYTVGGLPVTLSKGTNTGNTATITVTPSAGFTGIVTLSAAITSTPSNAQDLPALSWLPSNGQVNITGTTPQTATLVILTTPAAVAADTSPLAPHSGWKMAGGSALACILLLGIPARRRRWNNLLGMTALLSVFVFGTLGCTSAINQIGNAGGGGPNSGTTSGSYTITITGTSGAASITSTISLDVQ